MDEASRWSRTDALLDAALDRPAAERATWLEQACPDAGLRAQVLKLLALAEQDDTLLRPQGALSGPLWEELAGELGSAGEAQAQLASGDAVGPYRIEGILGRGGAGTVYRAWDPKLERPVAVKALSAAFAEDGANLRRFEREARILASLNHPNVASIYELLWASDRPYLVLELVEGETLGARLLRGPLPLREALHVGTQLAAALEEAHRNGVIHRDLKPSNAMLSASGRVKVLDFGLAKAAAPGEPRSEETTADGAVLGTPAYMSPEQARGEEVDRRTDVWALGCLLYEMLTGRRAFAGHTISEAIAAVLRDDVDWSRLPASTPPELRRLLRRCLRRDVGERLQDVGDARIELSELASGERDAPPPWRRAALRAAGALALAGLAFAVARSLPQRGAMGASPVVRASLALGPELRLWLGASHSLALSPDGTRLAFVGESEGRTQLYVRELARDAAQPVRNSPDARAPFFSPDGRFIGFFAQGELRKVPAAGGVPERIAAAGIESRGASWSEDGRIAFAQVGAPGLYVVPDKGGEPSLLSSVDAAAGELEHLWPEWLPGSKALALSVRSRSAAGAAVEELAVLSPGAGPPRRLRPGAQPVYSRSGHLVYARDGGLEAVAFDARRLEASGSSVAVLESLHSYPQGAAAFALSASGSFVYLPPLELTTLAWVTPDGSATPADAPPGTPGWPRLAPDGRRAAIHVGRPGSREVWLIDLERPRAYRQLTFGGGGFPVWSADGRRVAFASRREGAPSVYVIDVDGDAAPRRLLSTKGTAIPVSWSRQGRLAFYEIGETTQRDIWVADVDGAGGTSAVVSSPANELAPAFSPDGHALAYVSNETGRNEVYVRPYPGPGPVSAVSTDGGAEPVWSRDGSRLHYRHGDELMAVPVRGGPRLSLGAGRRLLRTEMVANSAGNPGYDVKPDGSGYLMLRPVAGASAEEVRLLLNWADELRQQARGGR